MDVPGLDDTWPGAREVNLTEFNEVRIRRFEHVHDLAALIDDLPQRYNLDSLNEALAVIHSCFCLLFLKAFAAWANFIIAPRHQEREATSSNRRQRKRSI
jgi:hypothetical protein